MRRQSLQIATETQPAHSLQQKLGIVILSPIYQIQSASVRRRNKNNSGTFRNTCSGHWCDQSSKRRTPRQRQDANAQTSLQISRLEAKLGSTIQ
jgi:hypothetical protein